ncbi:hypothetical protein FQR65_LT04896 [Abscondita terminalis]|nr:hypothetical protein FQR65_LT04896 [Abscondita terminalis]
MGETVIHTRSLGIASEGVKDQYADGKAANVWKYFIGDGTSRTVTYKNFLINLLRQNGCKRVLDVACGTGVDSIMLLEEGFEVISVDASDKMLKYALKTRWSRRKEPQFDKWIIEEANWITLYDNQAPMQAIKNFEKCIKPGGFLLIDHRNYDYIISTGHTPSKCLYYNSSHATDIQTSLLYVAGKPSVVMMDYFIEVANHENGNSLISEFRLSYYPHLLENFTLMLKEAFGNKANFKVYGDFQELKKGDNPNFLIHLVQKAKSQ